LDAATRIFESRPGWAPAQDVRQEMELRRLKDIIGEIAAENLELKMGLSG
jgi:hypothetical protein